MVTKEIKKFFTIPTYYIEIGVFVDNKSRKKEKYKVGINNAELMFIHEHGSPTNNIPDRPVLQLTIDYANEKLVDKTIDKAITKYIESGFNLSAYEKELNKLCIKMENYARDIIYSNDGRLKPNSEKVAKRKKGNHPLFDTGQLARSITCRLVR